MSQSAAARNPRSPLRRGVFFLGVLLLAALPAFPSTLAAQVDPPPPATGEGVVLDSIDVRGNQMLDRGTIVATFGVPLGTPITFRELQAGQHRLWATGRYADLGLSVREEDDGTVILVLRVEERPAIRRLEIRGAVNLTERNIRDALGLSPGDIYNPDRVAKARHFVRSELAQKGIPFAQLEAIETPVEDRPTEIDLILEVREGQRVTIAQVDFTGNQNISDSDLRRAMSSRPEGFWWFRTGEFQEDRLRADLTTNLPEFYASQGFLEFQILSDTLLIDPETGKGRIEVSVDEGPQYRLASFEIEGNRRFPTEQLEQYYQEEEGGLLETLRIRRPADDGPRIFDRNAFYDAAQRVNELYRNQGYLYADVEPVIQPVPPGEGLDHPAVNVSWRIREGDPAYVRRISIEGNTFTHDRVIREQIFILPGSLYSQQDVLRSYQAISGLGFFETPLPFPVIEDDPQTGDVDITFVVEERPTGSINFGTAMGGMTGVSGFIGYDQPNLFGQAKSGSLRWDFGRYQNNFTLQYSDPALFQSRVSGAISLFNSRDQYFSFATGERRRRGFLTRFGVPVPGAVRTRAFVGYSLSRTDYRLRGGVDDTSLFQRPPGIQSQVSTGLRRVTLDSPLFPSIGSELAWTTEFNGGILGGDGNFTKHTAQAQYWVPVGQLGGGGPDSQPIRLSLGLIARGGAIVGDAEDFPFDRFWLGGVQFGETLRGYEETTVTPRGYFPRGSPQIAEINRLGDAFLTVGAEYAVRISPQISVSTFYEAGNVWRDVREVDPTRLARGAGLGIMLVTPFGPIGLDYAYGFDQPTPGWQLHFRMGGGGVF